MNAVQLELKRKYYKNNYTVGKLYINGEYFCDTLEDTDRQLDFNMSIEDINNIKVKGSTAIPTGIYEIQITYSPRFKRKMPLLLNVPGYSGIRIHSGNTHEDTEGCILVGKNKAVGKVLNSRVTYNALFKLLTEYCKNGKVYIKITKC